MNKFALRLAMVAALAMAAAPAIAQQYAVPPGQDTAHPLYEQEYKSATAIVVGTDQAAGQGLLLNCSATGNVNLKMSDGGSMLISVPVGTIIHRLSVVGVQSASTTATCTYFNLKK